MFIRAEGVIQNMSTQVLASPLIKQQSTSDAALNHLYHNRRARTIHKTQ